MGRQIVDEVRSYAFPPNYVSDADWYAEYLRRAELLRKGPVKGSYTLSNEGRKRYEELKSENAKRIS